MISTSSNKSLSFFLPFYNEQDSLEKTVTLILQIAPALLSEFEILLINDGSTDGSLAIASALSERSKHIRIINFEKNQGFGSAYLAGVQNARYGFAQYLSTDGDVEADELRQIIQAWDGNSSLLQYAENPQDRHFSRFLLSKIFTSVTNFLSHSHWPYYNGFNIYSLKNKFRLEQRDFGFATQAYVLLSLFQSPEKTILLTTKSRFNDSGSKALTFRNISKAFLFFCFIIRNKL